jgi:hypothetical protein
MIFASAPCAGVSVPSGDFDGNCNTARTALADRIYPSGRVCSPKFARESQTLLTYFPRLKNLVWGRKSLMLCLVGAKANEYGFERGQTGSGGKS